MLCARILPAALLLGCLPAFTQDQQPESSPPPGNIQPMPNGRVAPVTPPQPWRIIPNRQLNPEWLQAPSDYRKTHPEQFATAQDQVVIQRFTRDSQTEIVWLPGGEFLSGRVCYNIRSYVVARDDRDSDSTHPVKFSTCQPASRYHVKSAEKPEIR